jgi:hypothetical protein
MSVVTLLLKSAKAHPNLRVWFRLLVRVWHDQMNRVFRPYRPEIHYMRGPGPKCQAKHRAVSGTKAKNRSRLEE